MSLTNNWCKRTIWWEKTWIKKIHFLSRRPRRFRRLTTAKKYSKKRSKALRIRSYPKICKLGVNRLSFSLRGFKSAFWWCRSIAWTRIIKILFKLWDISATSTAIRSKMNPMLASLKSYLALLASSSSAEQLSPSFSSTEWKTESFCNKRLHPYRKN